MDKFILFPLADSNNVLNFFQHTVLASALLFLILGNRRCPCLLYMEIIGINVNQIHIKAHFSVACYIFTVIMIKYQQEMLFIFIFGETHAWAICQGNQSVVWLEILEYATLWIAAADVLQIKQVSWETFSFQRVWMRDNNSDIEIFGKVFSV